MRVFITHRDSTQRSRKVFCRNKYHQSILLSNMSNKRKIRNPRAKSEQGRLFCDKHSHSTKGKRSTRNNVCISEPLYTFRVKKLTKKSLKLMPFVNKGKTIIITSSSFDLASSGKLNYCKHTSLQHFDSGEQHDTEQETTNRTQGGKSTVVSGSQQARQGGKSIDRAKLHAQMFNGNSGGDEDSTDDEDDKRHRRGFKNLAGHYASLPGKTTKVSDVKPVEDSDDDSRSVSAVSSISDTDSEGEERPIDNILQSIGMKTGGKTVEKIVSHNLPTKQEDEDDDIDEMIDTIEKELDNEKTTEVKPVNRKKKQPKKALKPGKPKPKGKKVEVNRPVNELMKKLKRNRSRIIKLKLPPKQVKPAEQVNNEPAKEEKGKSEASNVKPGAEKRKVEAIAPILRAQTLSNFTEDSFSYYPDAFPISSLPSFKKNKSAPTNITTPSKKTVDDVSVKPMINGKADHDRGRRNSIERDRFDRSKSPPLVYRRPSNSPPPNRRVRKGGSGSLPPSKSSHMSPIPLFSSPVIPSKSSPNNLYKRKSSLSSLPFFPSNTLTDADLNAYAENVMSAEDIQSRKKRFLDSCQSENASDLSSKLNAHRADYVGKNEKERVSNDYAKNKSLLMYLLAVCYNILALENIILYSGNTKFVTDTGKYVVDLINYVERETWKKGWQAVAGYLMAAKSIVGWNIDGFGIDYGYTCSEFASKRYYKKEEYLSEMKMEMVRFQSVDPATIPPQANLATRHPNQFENSGVGVGQIWTNLFSLTNECSQSARELLNADKKPGDLEMKRLKHLVKTAEIAANVSSNLCDINRLQFEYKEALLHIKSGLSENMKTSVWPQEALDISFKDIVSGQGNDKKWKDLRPNMGLVQLNDLDSILKLDFLMSLSELSQTGASFILEFGTRLGLSNFFK